MSALSKVTRIEARIYRAGSGTDRVVIVFRRNLLGVGKTVYLYPSRASLSRIAALYKGKGGN